VIPWFLLLVILAALGAALLRMSGSKWEPAISTNAVVAVLGGMATFLVGLRIVVPPDIARIDDIYTTVELGAYLTLAAAAGIATGGCLAMKEEGFSIPGLRGGSTPRTRGDLTKGDCFCGRC
jgi:hypothetical protein